MSARCSGAPWGRMGRVVSVDFSMPMLRAGDARYAESGSARAQVDAVSSAVRGRKLRRGAGGIWIAQCGRSPRWLSPRCGAWCSPGGRVVVLEFAQPHFGWFNSVYEAYSKYGMPLIGGLISGRREAYSYLPESVARWKSRSELIEMMRAAGLREPRLRDLTFGMVCVHTGTR